jgi:hypothetical protein
MFDAGVDVDCRTALQGGPPITILVCVSVCE